MNYDAIKEQLPSFQLGLAKGHAEGQADAARRGVERLCRVLGVELTEERQLQLGALDLAGLEQLAAQLEQHRAWPPA